MLFPKYLNANIFLLVKPIHKNLVICFSPSFSLDFSHIYLYLSNTTVTYYIITFLQTVNVANSY